MLKLTGFPLPDVGILTLTAMAGKADPAAVTRDDLDAAADYLEKFYTKGIGKSLAAGVVFPNSGFVQAAFDKPELQYKRLAWANFVLRGHQNLELGPILNDLEKKEYRSMVLRGVQGAFCAFTGDPAYLRVSRDMLPMINGRGIMNFSPMGEAGMPVSDVVLLAIHALPLGCVITQGALLAVESDDLALMFDFVKVNLETNRRFIHLANQNDYEKFPNLSSYKTRLMDVLVSSFLQGESKQETYRAPSLNAYHFSNNGTSARIAIYALPSSTLQFVRTASQGEYASAWRQIIQRGWIEEKPEAVELEEKAPKLTRRNFIYEDLFDLPEDARRFLRTYFLRHPLQKFKRGDPRNDYSPFTETDLISWNLTALFLKRILNMQENRINQIRNLGDRLAQYIQERDDRRLLKDIYFERQYWRFRAVLLRAMYGYTGSEPLVTFDGYAQIFESFEEGQGAERADWNLARDLLLIRIFERLHAEGYWSTVKETLQSEDAEEALKPVTE
ncbi:MAG: type I-B CRISPR-associated protein Cas8b1/Cst1 [Anaerolineae bacterium]|nr:type I-B CRISPR-associated protein Cas8b1/Cst1 [Anaerolineae bacterium]